MPSLAITWLGHATCLVRAPHGPRLLLDPWLETNPKCPPEWHKPRDIDAVLVSHGHGDHIEDAAAVARATNAPVVANFEICGWLQRKGVRSCMAMNKGGTVTVAGVRVTMVDALHSSSYEENGVTHYLGEAAGYVLRVENAPTLYFAGDTGIFGDMRLIAEMYTPEIACLPIGDNYTMGPEQAARAAQMLGVRQVLPIHFGTFPALTGTPDALRSLLRGTNIEVIDLKPGETAE